MQTVLQLGTKILWVCPANMLEFSLQAARASDMLKHELQRFTFAKEKTLSLGTGSQDFELTLLHPGQ